MDNDMGPGLILSLLALALAGCGQVEYHLATANSLEKMAGYPVDGYSRWTVWGDCDIYLLPRDQYPSEECYQAVLRHEKEHCWKGNFHPDTPEGSYLLECDR